jgi:hypothetical protein
MIIEKGFYHEEHGYWQAIIETDVYSNEDIANINPPGTIEVPVKPSALHKMVDGIWVEPTQEEIDEAKAEEVRNERNFRLKTEVDPVVTNPLRWNDMSIEQQQSWADYRRGLLDITLQEGFPHDVIWPTKPES